MFTYQGHPQLVSAHQFVWKQSKLDLFTVSDFFYFEISVTGLLVAYNVTAELVQIKGQWEEAGVGSEADISAEVTECT